MIAAEPNPFLARERLNIRRAMETEVLYQGLGPLPPLAARLLQHRWPIPSGRDRPFFEGSGTDGARSGLRPEELPMAGAACTDPVPLPLAAG